MLVPRQHNSAETNQIMKLDHAVCWHDATGTRHQEYSQSVAIGLCDAHGKEGGHSAP